MDKDNSTYLGNELSINKSEVVGTTSVKISHPKFRKGYSIRNVSTAGQIISIVLSNNDAAVANSGIVLSVGENFIDSNSEGYECWTGAISAISSAASGSVAIMERI